MIVEAKWDTVAAAVQGTTSIPCCEPTTTTYSSTRSTMHNSRFEEGTPPSTNATKFYHDFGPTVPVAGSVAVRRTRNSN